MIELCEDLVKYAFMLGILLGFITASILGAVILFLYVRDVVIKFFR